MTVQVEDLERLGVLRSFILDGGFVLRYVADRMSDRGKGGAGCQQNNFGNPELRYVGNDQAVAAYFGLMVVVKPNPPTRQSIRADPNALRRLMAQIGSLKLGRAFRSAQIVQTSTCSAIAKASSTSMPRYLIVLTILGIVLRMKRWLRRSHRGARKSVRPTISVPKAVTSVELNPRSAKGVVTNAARPRSRPRRALCRNRPG